MIISFASISIRVLIPNYEYIYIYIYIYLYIYIYNYVRCEVYVNGGICNCRYIYVIHDTRVIPTYHKCTRALTLPRPYINARHSVTTPTGEAILDALTRVYREPACGNFDSNGGQAKERMSDEELVTSTLVTRM